MKIHRRLAALAALILFACGASACGGDDESADTFNILLITSLSGELAAVGEANEATTRAAADVFNERGGANGRDIGVTVVDDAGDPNQAVTVLQEALASGTEYHLIIPGASSNEVQPLLPLLAENPALQLSVASGFDDPEKWPHYFSSAPALPQQVDAMVTELLAEGHEHATLIGADTAQVHAGADAVSAEAEEQGLEFDSVFVPADAVDATAQMQQAVATGADVLLFDGVDPVAPVVVKARSDLGIDLPAYGNLAFTANNFESAGLTDEHFEGVKLLATHPMVQGDPVTESEDMTEFLAALEEYESERVLGMISYVSGYNVVALAVGAADLAESVDGAEMAKALEEAGEASEIPGLLGPAKLYEDGSHFLQYERDDFLFIDASPKKADGFLIPAS